MDNTFGKHLGIALSLFLGGSVALARPGLPTRNGNASASLPKLNARVSSATDFLHDLRAHVLAGNTAELPRRVAKQLEGIPAEHAELIADVVSHALTGYVEQAVAAQKQNPDGAFPEARTAHLDTIGRAEQPLVQPTTRVPSEVSIRSFDARFMGAHDDARVVAAHEKYTTAQRLYQAGTAPYGEVTAAFEARNRTLAAVRNETLGTGSVAAYDKLSAIDWAYGLKHDTSFSDPSRMVTIPAGPAVRAPSKPIESYGPFLYNAIRRLNFHSNAIIKPRPTPNTLRAAMYKMMNRPVGFLAVYALTNDLFASAAGGRSLEAAARAHVAALPAKERDFFVLFSEMSKLREQAAGAVVGPRHDVDILQALSSALGTQGPKGVAKNAPAPTSRVSGYALGLMINNESGTDAWNSHSSNGFRLRQRVNYVGRYAPPWTQLETK